MRSALASSGSVLEPAGTGSIRYGGSFSQLLTESTPIAPHYQNLVMQTHNIHTEYFLDNLQGYKPVTPRSCVIMCCFLFSS